MYKRQLGFQHRGHLGFKWVIHPESLAATGKPSWATHHNINTLILCRAFAFHRRFQTRSLELVWDRVKLLYTRGTVKNPFFVRAQIRRSGCSVMSMGWAVVIVQWSQWATICSTNPSSICRFVWPRSLYDVLYMSVGIWTPHCRIRGPVGVHLSTHREVGWPFLNFIKELFQAKGMLFLLINIGW